MFRQTEVPPCCFLSSILLVITTELWVFVPPSRMEIPSLIECIDWDSMANGLLLHGTQLNNIVTFRVLAWKELLFPCPALA